MSFRVYIYIYTYSVEKGDFPSLIESQSVSGTRVRSGDAVRSFLAV